jgi:hypothetical protein
MTQSDLECLKEHIDQVVEIETWKGERLLINVISVFDQESDPDVFFHDVTADPKQKDFAKTVGHALPLHKIASVRVYPQQGGRA